MLVLWSFSSCICGRFGCVFPCHNLSLRIMSYSIFAVIFAAHLLSRSQQRESLIANAMYSCVSIAYLLNYIDESIRNPLPTPVTIPEHTLKSIPFLVTRVMVESFFYYSSYFSAMNSQGKLLTAYNLTPMKNFLPTIVVYSRVNKADFSYKLMYRILWPIQRIR